MNITPSQIILYVNIFGLVVILIGFLIGVLRGTFKASYRMIVTLVIIVGLWFLTPTIFGWFINMNIGSLMANFGSDTINDYQVTTIKDLLEFATEVILGLIEKTDTGWTTYTGEIVIAETQIYGLLYGVFEMVFRILFIVIIIILNWTIFRFLFGIIYYIIRPKKKVTDKKGKKHRAKPKALSRLGGGLIGAANAIFILFLIFVPLSGLFSIGEDVGSLMDKASSNQEDGKQIAYLSVGGEVVKLSESTLEDFGLEDVSEWAGVYRGSFIGQMFSVKIDGVAIDNRVFDDLFVVKTESGNVKFREEINNVAMAVEVIAEKVYEPLKANDFKFTWSVIDELDGETITAAFDKLSDLKLIQVVVPVGVEFISNQSKELDITSQENQMFDVVDIVNSIKDANMKNVISKLGESFGSLLDAVHDSNMTIQQMMESEDPVQEMLNSLLSVNGEGVSNVFNALADIEILDELSKPLGAFLDNYVTQQLTGFLLMKPALTTDEDNYIYISGIKTNILWDGVTNLKDMEITLSDDGYWILNGTLTTIDGKDNQYKLDFSNISISQEIRNIGNIFKAFQDLGISSITEFANYLSGKESNINWDETNFDYDHLEKLFNAILASPNDFYFTYSKTSKDNNTLVWKLNDEIVTLSEYGITVSGAPEEGDRFIVRVKNTSTEPNIVVNDVDVTYDTTRITNVDVTKNTFLQKIEGYHNIGSSLLSCNTDNIYCLVNNILPASMRESLTIVPIDGGDVASLVMAAKLLIDHGLIGNAQEADYSQLLGDDELVGQLIDSIMMSNMLDKNITTVINAIIVLATGDKIIEIHEEDWSANKADDIKALFKVVGKVFKYKDKFSDIKSLTQEELDDLFGAIGDALTSGIISANIGKFVDYLNDQNFLGDFILIGMEKEYWTPEEAGYLKEGLMMFVDMIMAEDSNIMSQLFQLAEDERLDSLLKSRFLILNIVNNLYKFAGEGGQLSEFLCLDNIDKDSEAWFDVIDEDGNITKKGELRLLLTNAAKLFKGINDMGDSEVLIRSLIGNIGSLTNEIGGESDDVGEILESIILSDTLIKFMKSLPEKTSGILKIDNPDDIEWRDSEGNPGELRKLLKAISILLVDKEIDEHGDEQTVVLYDKLLSDELSEKIGVFLNLSDEEIAEVLASAVITDTTKGIILDYSEGDEAFIYLRNREKTEEEWSDCLAQFLISARILLETTDESGNKTYTLDKLQGSDTNAFLGMLLELSDEEIDKLTESEIIVDTIADKLIDYGKQDGSVLAVPGHLSSEGWTTLDWKEEEKHMIKSLTLILGNDSSKFDSLGSSADSLISMITKLVNDDPAQDKLHETLLSDVIVATMAKQILKYGEGEGAALDTSNVTGYDVDNDLSDWRDEEEKLIRSAKLLLADEEGNIEISKLGQSTNKLFEYIVNLSDEELDKVVASTIFTDTIAKNIRSFGEGEGAVLVTTGTNDYTTDEWRGEIEDIIHSVKVLIAEEDPVTHKYTVEVNTLSNAEKINDMFKKIVELKSDVHDSNEDELGKAIKSIVISDTLIKQIKNQNTLTINESKEGFSWRDTNIYQLDAKEGELRKFIVSIDTLFAGDVDITNLNANSIVKQLRSLKNELGAEDDQVGPLFESMILKDTMIVRIMELNNTSLVINYDEDDERWVDYDNKTKPGELRLVIQSVKIIFGEEDKDFSDISSSLKVDDLLDKSDEDIHAMLESNIVRYTASKEVVTVLTGVNLSGYIELNVKYNGDPVSDDPTVKESERREMIADDLEGLVKTLRDLRTYGVNYEEFSFEKFQTAYETHHNDVPDSLQQSKLVIHSMSKMMRTILDQSVDNQDIRDAITTDVTDEEWRTVDSAGKQPFEVGFVEGNVEENGELRKVFKVMNSLESFNVASFDINADGKKDVLKDINHSKVTHNVIPTVIDKSLTTIDEWKYAAEDTRILTVAEWDNEIDVFAEILTIAGEMNMNNLDVTTADTNVLGKVVKTMALSRYLNVSILGTKVKDGIEKAFQGADGLTIHVNDDVYAYTPKTETAETYLGKITTWNGNDITIELINASTALDDKEGEVDNVMDAVLQLQNITYQDVLYIVPVKVYGTPINSYTNAHSSGVKLGNFLDRCGMTRMLEDVPTDIFGVTNSVLAAGSYGNIPYNKANTAPGYCLGLFDEFIETNYAAGNYN